MDPERVKAELASALSVVARLERPDKRSAPTVESETIARPANTAVNQTRRERKFIVLAPVLVKPVSQYSTPTQNIRVWPGERGVLLEVSK